MADFSLRRIIVSIERGICLGVDACDLAVCRCGQAIPDDAEKKTTPWLPVLQPMVTGTMLPSDFRL